MPELPHDPEVVAFVLRVRSEPLPRGRRTVIMLDEVDSQERWHFSALDSAFAKIRDTLALHEPGTDS